MINSCWSQFLVVKTSGKCGGLARSSYLKGLHDIAIHNVYAMLRTQSATIIRLTCLSLELN